MKVSINKLVLSFILCLFVLPSFAETEKTKDQISDSLAKENKTQEEVLSAFTAWDKTLENLYVDFDQQTTFEDILISSNTGKLAKEGQNLILDTYENGKLIQRAWTDKKIIKIFDPEGNLITTSDWQTWQQAQTNKALFDFGNYTQVLKDHEVKSFTIQEEDYLLVLEGKSEQDTYEITFVLDEKSFPKQITLESQGVKTTTNLKDIKINQENKKKESKK